MYYTINETMARRANNAYSFSDYREGSATAEYRQMVDRWLSGASRAGERLPPRRSTRCLTGTPAAWPTTSTPATAIRLPVLR